MLRRFESSHLCLLILCAWIFVLPSNLFMKFGESQAYIHGLLVDYLIPKLYLSDLFGIGLIMLNWGPAAIKNKIKFNPNSWGIFGIVMLLGFRQLWTPHPIAATWMWLRICLVASLGICLWSNRKLLQKPAVYWSLVTSVIFQAAIAVYQFIFQRSVAGYWFLGESDLRRGIGLATGVFDGAEKVLAYGTTAHPNILAGVGVIYCWVIAVIYFNRKKQPLPETLGLTMAIAAGMIILWTTQSLAATTSMLLGLLVLFLSKQGLLKPQVIRGLITVGLAGFLLIPIGFHLSASQIDQPSIYRRAFLNQAGFNIVRDQPLIGIGLNQTTAVIEEYTRNPEVVRFVQPVHHGGLLMLAETGVLGITLGFLVLRKMRERNRILIACVVIIPVLATDHYLVTLATGQLLLVLVLLSSSLLDIDETLS